MGAPVLGPCKWNGNEIAQEAEPLRGVAGLAPDSPEEWGPIFAAAPELLRDCEWLLQLALDLVKQVDYCASDTAMGLMNCAADIAKAQPREEAE